MKQRLTAGTAVVGTLDVKEATVERITVDALAANDYYAAAGDAANPTFSFGDDPTTGLYLSSAGVLGLAAGGTASASVDSTGITSNGIVAAADGTTLAPAFTFSSETSTGMCLPNAARLALCTLGTQRMLVYDLATEIKSTVLAVENGSALLPSYTFSSNANTGMYRVAANTLGWATGGVQAATLNSSGLLTTVGGVSVPNGTAAAPSITFTSDTDTGVYHSATNAVGLSAGGSAALVADGTTVTLSRPLTLQSTGGFAAASLAVQSTSASVITPTANVTVTTANATVLGNLCIVLLSGTASGAAATVGTLAASYRPAATATGGSIWVTTSAPVSTSRTVSVATSGVVTPGSALANGDVWQLQVIFLTS